MKYSRQLPVSRFLSCVYATRPYIGVLKQYEEAAVTSMQSEGMQAVRRLKEYRDKALDCLNTREFVLPNGKYRRLRPIIKVLHGLSDESDLRKQSIGISMVFSVLRIYDLYQANEQQVKDDLDEFKETYLERYTKGGDIETQYYSPESFSLNDFESFLSKYQVELFGRFKSAKPTEKAKLLSKKGTVRFNGTLAGDESNLIKSRFLPSIVGAPLEYAFIELNYPEYKDVLCKLGDILGQGHGLSFSKSWPKTTDEVLSLLNSGDWTVYLRRNVAFPDKGGKVRKVGIADYVTQYVLDPIHQAVFAFLKRTTSDYTESHDKGFEFLRDYATSGGQNISCFDLSSATDLFPIGVQRLVLEFLYKNRELSYLWGTVMKFPFEGKAYKYGQPMGLLSSWAVFALSHHVIVRYAYYLQYGRLPHWTVSRWQGIYGIVGDDIFILDPLVALQYRKLMSQLGVQINESKSLITSDSRDIYEFVKRNGNAYGEISAISPSLVQKAYTEYESLRSLIILLDSRGIYYEHDVLLEDVCNHTNSGSFHHWINATSGIPTECGGLWTKNSKVPLASPEELLLSLAQYAKSSSKFLFRGDLINGNGTLTVDDLQFWIDRIPLKDIRSTPIAEYERTYATSHNLLANELTNRVWGSIRDMYHDKDRYVSSSFLINSESYQNTIRLLSESDGNEFYLRKEIAHKISKDYIHRVIKRLKHLNGLMLSGDPLEFFRSILQPGDLSTFSRPSRNYYEDLFNSVPNEAQIEDVETVSTIEDYSTSENSKHDITRLDRSSIFTSNEHLD